MKLLIILAAASMSLTALPAAAQAACALSTGIVLFQGNGNNAGSLRHLLVGNTVCGRPGAGYPGNANDRWQEQHLGGPTSGELWDFKLGAGHAVDPRKQVGNWEVSGNATGVISHAYGGSPFQWNVYGPQDNTAGASVYRFCSGGVEFARAYVRAGTTAGCGGSYPP